MLLLGGPKMNKLEQVSSDHHQMSLAGAGYPRREGIGYPTWQEGGYPIPWCMWWCHLPYPPSPTDICITSPQLLLRAVIISLKNVGALWTFYFSPVNVFVLCIHFRIRLLFLIDWNIAILFGSLVLTRNTLTLSTIILTNVVVFLWLEMIINISGVCLFSRISLQSVQNH